MNRFSQPIGHVVVNNMPSEKSMKHPGSALWVLQDSIGDYAFHTITHGGVEKESF